MLIIAQVSGRVIIDSFAYYQSNDIVEPQLRPLTGGRSGDEKVEHTNQNDAKSWDGRSETSSECLEDGPEMAATKDPSGDPSRSEDLTPLTDDECLLATPWLRGLDLKTKEWGNYKSYPVAR